MPWGKANDQKYQRKVRHQKQVAREKIKRDSVLYHPLIGHVQEIGAQQSSKSALHERQALLCASQLRKEELHRFKPWPAEYTISQVIRNPQSGALIAGMYTVHGIQDHADRPGGASGGGSSVS